MPASVLKEKFDGLREQFNGPLREYEATYQFHGIIYGSQFPSTLVWNCKNIVDPTARLVHIGELRQLGPTLNEITVRYSNAAAHQSKKDTDYDQPENPLAQAIRRTWSIGLLERHRPTDWDGKPYVNSYGDWLYEPPALVIPYLIQGYARNEATFNRTLALQCGYHINNSPMPGASTYCALCARITGSEQMSRNDIPYVEVYYELWILPDIQLNGKPLTWKELFIDAGHRWKLKYGDPGYTGYVEKDTRYPTTQKGHEVYGENEVLLDGKGQLLSNSDVLAGKVSTLEFRCHMEWDLNVLGLPA